MALTCLIEGGSGTGKTSVATELERRGYRVVHGDRVLAMCGDPLTGMPIDPAVVARHAQDAEFISRHHCWDEAKLRALVAAGRATGGATFVCGASRNRQRFMQLFDAVFVLQADWATISRRIDARVDEWGSEPAERAEIRRLFDSGEYDVPGAIMVDAMQPLEAVVDFILACCR